MPIGLPQLSQEEIDLIARWIDEGARRSVFEPLRGDVDRNGIVEITDPIYVLEYLFLEGPELYCEPVAEVTSDGRVDLADPGLHTPLSLPRRSGMAAAQRRRAGGVYSRESRSGGRADRGRSAAARAIELSFFIEASDPDGDGLEYSIVSGPDGLCRRCDVRPRDVDASVSALLATIEFACS